MIVRGVAEVSAERSALRNALAAHEFSDDGETLRGPVLWSLAPGATAVATVAISFPKHFPFGPPSVKVLDTGHPLDVTFHIDIDGSLCRWGTSEPAETVSWLDAEGLLDRITGWLERTADGWRGDDDCDLERYVSGGSAGSILIYNSDEITPQDGSVASSKILLHRSRTVGSVTHVLAETRKPPSGRQWKPDNRHAESRRTRLPDNAQQLVYVADIGAVTKPIAVWPDVQAALGTRGEAVRRMIVQGAISDLVLMYSRGSKHGTLGLAVEANRKGEIALSSREAADSCVAARSLRTGPQAELLAAKKIAIVGCGAVGSFIADTLYRQGARHLTLIDGERYRPGNAVRHVAPLRFVGLPKAIAVMETLRSHNLDADAVTAQHQRIADPDEARRLYRNHDLVIDATADNRTTALLIWASEVVCKPMITVCVQRDGGIARADRTPLRHLEHHLAAVSPLADANAPLVERGCGDSVSPTPPASVIAAAELGVELIVDLLVGDGRLPPTLMRVLNEQPDEPSTTLPICTAQPCERAVPHG